MSEPKSDHHVRDDSTEALQPLWDAAAYARDAGFVASLGRGVLEWAPLRKGERVLDLGCGDGVLTAELVHRGARVVGIDASPSMVEAARSQGLDARVMDAQELVLPELFDGVFTNAALHWMPRTEDVLAGVAKHLRPGGWFVGECGGRSNVAAVLTALRAVLRAHHAPTANVMPWTYRDPDTWSEQLSRAGFVVERSAWFPRPTAVPAGLVGWIRTFCGPFLDPLPSAMRASVVAEVTEVLRESLQRDDGSWMIDYVRLRFASRRCE